MKRVTLVLYNTQMMTLLGLPQRRNGLTPSPRLIIGPRLALVDILRSMLTPTADINRVMTVAVLRVVKILARRPMGPPSPSIPRQASTGISGPSSLFLSYTPKGFSPPIEISQMGGRPAR